MRSALRRRDVCRMWIWLLVQLHDLQSLSALSFAASTFGAVTTGLAFTTTAVIATAAVAISAISVTSSYHGYYRTCRAR